MVPPSTAESHDQIFENEDCLRYEACSIFEKIVKKIPSNEKVNVNKFIDPAHTQELFTKEIYCLSI